MKRKAKLPKMVDVRVWGCDLVRKLPEAGSFLDVAARLDQKRSDLKKKRAELDAEHLALCAADDALEKRVVGSGLWTSEEIAKAFERASVAIDKREGVDRTGRTL